MRKPVKYTLLGMIPVVLLGIFTGFFLCGSFFLTRVVLPVLSGRAGIEIAAERMEWSPFLSRLKAEKLRIGPVRSPCFQAEHAEFTYALQELLRGNWTFSDLFVERGDFTLFRVAGGWSCFRPAPASAAEERSGEKKGGAPAEKRSPPRFDLSRIRVADSRLTLVYGESGSGGAFELSGLSGSSPAFRNGEPFAAELSGRVKLATSRASHVDDGRVTLSFEAMLDEALRLRALKTKCGFTELAGTVGGVALDGGALSLDLEAEEHDGGFEIDRFQLIQSRNGTPRSIMDLSGAIRRAPLSIRVEVKRGTVSPEVMAICTDLGFGFNPGHATLECRGKFSYGNRCLSSDGMLRLTRSGDAIFGLERIDIPDFRLDVEHRAEVDFNSSRIDLARFSATVVTEGRESASLRLRKPVRYSWQTRGKENTQSAEFDLSFDRFDLSQLRFALPPESPLRSLNGKFSAKAQLLFRHNLSSVGVLGNGRLEEGGWRFNGRRFPAGEARVGVDLLLRRNLDVQGNSITLSLHEGERELAAFSCSGSGSLPRREGRLRMRMERIDPDFAVWFFPAGAPYAAGWKRLELSPAELSAAVTVARGGRAIRVQTLELSAERRGNPFATLRLTPFTWDAETGALDHGPGFTFRGSLPAEAVNPLIGTAAKFRSGAFECALTGKLNRNLNGGLIDGTCSLDEAVLDGLHGRRFAGFGVQNRFSLYLPDFQTLEVKTADFYLRSRGRPALRLECPGTFQFQEGRYRGEWQLRYLNEQFLSLLAPNLAAEAQFSGRIQVNAQNHFESFRAACALECSRWLPPDRAGEPFSGRLLAVFDSSPHHWSVRNFRLKFSRAEQLLADFTGECRVDRFRADGPVSIRLSSRQLEFGDLLKLFSGGGLFGSADAAASAHSATPAPAKTGAVGKGALSSLHFGPRPIDFGCRLEKVRLTPELAGALEGRFRLREGSVHSEYLNVTLDGARFDGKVRAESVPEGIRCSLAVRGNDRMPCRPLLEFLTGVRSEGFEGVLSSLDSSVNWLDDGTEGSFPATLSGYFRMKLRDVVIPNGLSNSLFGRLFLLPVDLVGQLSSLMPEELNSLSDGFFSGSSLRWALRTLRLSSGTLELSADRGEVMVRECRFLGDWIDRISFSGMFQLGGDQNLQLESQLLIAGIPLTVPVRGTLSKPSISLQPGAIAGVGEFVNRIRVLKLFDFENRIGVEPALLIHDLSPKETLRELRYIFDELFKRKR